MASLRMGRMSRFAAVGALGTLVNLVVMWLLVTAGAPYVAAAVVAAEVSILHNFLMQERFVFRDMRDGVHSWRARVLQFFAFNNVETLLRLPFLVLLVSVLGMFPVLAQGLTLAVAFLLRFFFVSRVVYRPGAVPTAPLVPDALEGSEAPAAGR